MPIVDVTGTDISYHLIAFDAQGRERSDDPDGRMSDVIADALETSAVTDVFLVSHGWRGDLPAADEQYQRWIRAMAGCAADRARVREVRPGFSALLIGLHWPSEPFGEEDFQDVSFDTDEVNPVDVDAEVTRWAQRLDTDAEGTAALRTIIVAAAEDPAPPALPPEVRQAYLDLDRSLDLGSGDVGGPPDADREPFDPDRAYATALDEEVDFAGGFSVGDLLTPLKQLSFWTMKARARTVGESGAHKFLNRLQQVRKPDPVRFHLMGHSFGCIAVTAMIAGPHAGAGPVRPVSSLALVQGAVSLWSYCPDIPVRHGTPGYFRALCERKDVAGPILTTRSVHDRAVGFWYPKAAGAAGEVDFGPGEFPTFGGIGTFGIQGSGLPLHDGDMKDEHATYEFKPEQIYNLRADDMITGGNFFSGAHSEITGPAVAHCVWQGVIAAP